jgi:flagellar hook-basal body complex protein FliE
MIPSINPMSAATQALQGLSGSGAQTGAQTNATTGAGSGSAPFSDLLSDAVGQVNQLEAQAQTAVSGLMTGAGVDVHQAMIATEKANMAFEMALAVRNKAVQAYQSVMGMQF